MYIQYENPSPRAGVREHVSRSTGEALVAAGFASEVLLSDEERRKLRFGITQPPAPLAPPTWDVIRTVEYGYLVVVRKAADGSRTVFDGPPDRTKWPDCPEHIAKKFAELKQPGEAPVSLPFAGNNWRERLPQ